jgi:hypothetical protein
MASPLDRLADLVRQAESRSRAQKLGGEVQQAAEKLRIADHRVREAEKRLAEVRPIRLKELAKADTDELLLKDLIKKLAHTLAGLEVEQQKSAEADIVAAQHEINEIRAAARADLDDVTHEAESARSELRPIRELYASLRREVDQIMPELAPDFVEEDRLIRETDSFFPAGQVQALAREIDDGERHYGMLEHREQFAQLRIWIGKFRRLQALAESDHNPFDDDTVTQLREIFPRLVGISKQYMPGYIEAFSRTFETNWDAYVADAIELMKQASDTTRREREVTRRPPPVPERPLLTPRTVLGERYPVTAESRRRTAPASPESSAGNESVSATRGRRVLLLGGAVREERRRTLQQAFAFEELEWMPYEGPRPGLLDELGRRLRDRHHDLLLILDDHVDSLVAESLEPVCRDCGIPCLVIENGSDPTHMAAALSRLKPAQGAASAGTPAASAPLASSVRNRSNGVA